MAYNDIDSGKVLNKEGLLELSGQIKGYINTNMPSSYVLPTASTSTLGGVKVDGDTITIADGVISANSSSGASYTAGDGINIDENSEISTLPQPSLGLLLIQSTDTSYNPYIQDTTANTTWEDFIKLLRKGKIVRVNGNPSWSSGYQYELNASTFLGNASAKFYFCNLDTSSAINNISTGWSYYPRNGHVYYYDGVVLYKLAGATGWGQQIKMQLAGQSLIEPISTVVSRINTRIPSTPSTDGTYILKSVVSSGTATNSWESVTVGGSY